MNLFKNADRYVKQSTWIDFGLLKTCVCALGIIVGLFIPKEHKKSAMIGAASVFSMTFCPLMIRYYKTTLHKESE